MYQQNNNTCFDARRLNYSFSSFLEHTNNFCIIRLKSDVPNIHEHNKAKHVDRTEASNYYSFVLQYYFLSLIQRKLGYEKKHGF